MGINIRRECTRAFVKQGGKKVYLERDRIPGSHAVTAERASKGYLLLQGFIGDKDNRQFDLVKLDLKTGLRQPIAREPAPLNDCYGIIAGKPSPSGDFILLERSKAQTCNAEDSKTDLEVTLFNARLQPLGTPYDTVVTRSWQLNWISETAYELKDDERTQQFEVPLD